MRALFTFMLVTVLSFAASAAKPSQNHTRLTGNIGPYDATMYINENYEGYYYYNDCPKSHFTLKCVTRKAKRGSAQESVVIKEYTAKGNNSGTFKGTMEFTSSLWQFYTGTFTNSKGKKYSFCFAARLVP